MRFANVAAIAVTVLTGFAGSMTAAHALSAPAPALDLPLPIPTLTPAPPAAAPATELTVTFRADAEATPRVMHLSCDPTGGDHPRADEACAVLADARANGENPFAAPPRDQMCTYIYGGPQRAAVSGSWNGRTVKATFSRTNGCEIARWDAIEPVLSPTPPAG